MKRYIEGAATMYLLAGAWIVHTGMAVGGDVWPWMWRLRVLITWPWMLTVIANAGPQ